MELIRHIIIVNSCSSHSEDGHMGGRNVSVVIM